MFPSSSSRLNQGLEQGGVPSPNMAFYHHDSSLSHLGLQPFGGQQPPRALHNLSPLVSASGSRDNTSKDVSFKHGGGVVERGASCMHGSSNIAMWPWAEEGQDLRNKTPSFPVNEHNSSSNNNNNLSVSGMKMKKVKARRKVREPRFCFKTMSDVDVLDDGYKWRKYGQKVVKNTQHPRSYYRCTQDNCRVKKRVERLAEDPRMVITTYEGRHAHSPSQDGDEQQTTSHFNFFW